MEYNTIKEVVDTLIGGITPIGDSNYDTKVKENIIKQLTLIEDLLSEVVCVIENTENMSQNSISDCRKQCIKYIKYYKDLIDELEIE